MLQELSIRNFAIIDDLSICFQKGMTVLSGETGAGKSIIINAVNLLLGSRATPSLIRTGADSAELEALFAVPPSGPVAARMADGGYDPSDGLLIRRIVSRKDRHRIYINGRLATIAALAPIAENLASISGQHAHQSLLREDQHLTYLDQFGGLMPLRGRLRDSYHSLIPLIQKLAELKRIKRHRAEQTELLRFQSAEIETAAISPEEDASLEKEHKRLKNAETLYQTVFTAIETLYGARGAVSERLGEVQKDLVRAAELDADLSPRAQAAAEAAYLVEDVTAELRSYLTELQVDDRRLEEVESRLDELAKLKRKYGGSLDAVLAKLASIRARLKEVGNIDHEITAAGARIGADHRRLATLAQSLSRKRQKAAERFAQKVERELASLKMERTRFAANLETQPADSRTDPYLQTEGAALTDSGIDRAAFLIAPNVGEALKPMAGIASGGELSRVVLALKAILAETDAVATVVFDEVDAGIGGGVAEVVGQKLRSLARHHQIICITHLPQIAKFADNHFRITKGVSGGRTTTRIQPVLDEERVEEIARMLGGVKITAATRAHARELLGQNRPAQRHAAKAPL